MVWNTSWLLKKIGFKKGVADCKLFIRETSEGLLLVIIFVDDIIFGGDDKLSVDFAKEMQRKFEMSMIALIKYFLGLNVKQTEKGLFINERDIEEIQDGWLKASKNPYDNKKQAFKSWWFYSSWFQASKHQMFLM